MDCFYIGKVLDIYKQVASSHYGSVDNATSASSLSCLVLRVYFLIQVQTVSYLFILHWHLLGLFLIVHRPPPPNLMMAWEKMCPHSPGINASQWPWVAHSSTNQPPGLPFWRTWELSTNALIRLSFAWKAAGEALKKIKIKSQNGKIIKNWCTCMYILNWTAPGWRKIWKIIQKIEYFLGMWPPLSHFPPFGLKNFHLLGWKSGCWPERPYRELPGASHDSPVQPHL